MSTEHTHDHTHGECCKTAAASGSGFKYFVPGLIIGFILGAVVGVILPEMRGGGPPLQPRTDSGGRVMTEEERNPAPPELPTEGSDAAPEGTTPPATTPPTTPEAPASGGGH